MENSKQTRLKVITPNGIFFDAFVSIVTVETTEGKMGIMKNHIPTVASLTIGSLNIELPSSKDFKECAISGGLLYVEKEKVTIITDDIVFKKDIDVVANKNEVKRLETMIKQKQSDSEMIKLELALSKNLNKIRIKEK
ncbi:MAG: ATP synthase F1 subunit epsilon [Mycoplasma sp.]|nr:ATP synthase F1 subunit epsilon [Mycoplasma sp.]